MHDGPHSRTPLSYLHFAGCSNIFIYTMNSAERQLMNSGRVRNLFMGRGGGTRGKQLSGNEKDMQKGVFSAPTFTVLC
jgi:hypothetical protein